MYVENEPEELANKRFNAKLGWLLMFCLKRNNWFLILQIALAIQLK